MKNLFLLRRLLLSCLVMAGALFPAISRGQTILISGDIDVCVGDVAVYTPNIVDANLSYAWTVNPASSGTVLSGNSSGANIEWYAPGPANVMLTVTDPQNGGIVVYTGSLGITVNPLPAPYITTEVLLGCQPLDLDSNAHGGAKPQFDSSHCELVCANSTVLYTAHGNAGSSFTWTATGAVNVNPGIGGLTCEIKWGAPGFGTVSMTETTPSGCEAVSSFCVEMVASPTAEFVAQPNNGNPITICRDGEVVLLDQSTGSAASPLVSWLWIWGDGQQSTSSPGSASTPVTHQYSTPGIYEINLVVANACGCTDTFSMELRVLNPVAPKIACPRVVCEGEQTVYTVDQPCSAQSWSVEGGTIVSATATTLVVAWDNVDPNTGFGYVMYTGCDPCPVTTTEEVPVILRRAEIQGPQAICEGAQYVYRMPKWPATLFKWGVSGPAVLAPTDQRNEIALTSTGTGTVNLTVNYTNTVLGCEGSAELRIDVLPPGLISGSDYFCQGETRNYNLGGPAGNWTLRNPSNAVVATFFGPVFSYSFSDAGVYRLSVTGSAFCPPEDYLITVVGTPPPPDLISGPDRACPGVPIRYDAGNPVPGTTFNWSVTGGGSATAALGDFSYITFGGLAANVQVVRVTTDAAHCASSMLSKTVLEAVPPLSITGLDSVCHSTENAYMVSYGEGDSYDWSLSDPNRGSVVANGDDQATVLWNLPAGSGSSVWLRVKIMKCGSAYWDSIRVFVRGTPVITGITADQDTVCSWEQVVLHVSTSFDINSATGYTWQWGDGPGVNTPGFPGGAQPYTFTHIYNTDGSSSPVVFTPAITIQDPNGCLGSTTATAPLITVMPRPIAVVSPSGPITHCGAGWSETLLATETTGIGGSNGYAWTVPFGATPPGNTPNYPGVQVYGGYYVTVTNSVFGCQSNSNTVQIVENCGPGGGCGTPPLVSLTADTAQCDQITVNATVTGVVTGYSWALPAGVSGTGSATQLIATADAAGLYTIGYTVYYDTGCQNTTHINVLVPYLPELRYEIGCNQAGGNYEITLFDHSTQYPLTPITNRAYYGPGGLIGSGAGLMTVNTNQAGGTTETYYEVIDGVNGVCTSYVSVTTPAFPTVTLSLDPLSPNPGCAEDVVFNFHYTASGLGLGFFWDFNDGTFNAGAYNPTGKVYYTNVVVTRTTTLTVTDEYGCYASDNTSVTVVPNPYKGQISASLNPVCQGNPVTLAYLPDLSTPVPPQFTWYEQTNPIAYTTTPAYTVYAPGGYWVEGLDNYGCKVEASLAPVTINQVPGISISGNTGQCVGQSFTLRSQDYGSGYSYTWSGAGSGSGPSLSQTWASPGSYTYYVQITDLLTGCSRTSPAFTITVSNPPSPPGLSYSILNCNPYELQLTATGAAGVYNWSNGMSGSVITTAFGGPYQVTLTDLNGCRVQNSFMTPRSPADYLWVFPTGCFCHVPGSHPYLIGPIIPFSYWAWLKNSVVDVWGSGYMPNYTITPGNIYNMTLDNGFCQVSSGDMYYQSDTCNQLAGRPGAEASLQPGSRFAGAGGDYNALQLTPNPAAGQTTVRYRFAKGPGPRSITLIDMLGRSLQTYTIDQDSGRLVLDLDGLAAGMYRVVMRREGIVLQQSKLSLTR